MLYDSDCGFCRWTLAWVLRWDRHRRLRPMPLQAPEADPLLGDLSDEERRSQAHLVAPDGRRWSGGAAVAPVLRLLPGGRVPAALAAAAPRLTARAYVYVATHRSQISRFVPAAAKRRADGVIADRARRVWT